jgi:hypothetical protein
MPPLYRKAGHDWNLIDFSGVERVDAADDESR